MVGKDQRYDFVTQHLKPGTVIRTQGAWRRFLKANKMTDDLSLRELSRLDPAKSRAERARKLREQVTPIFQQALARRCNA